MYIIIVFRKNGFFTVPVFSSFIENKCQAESRSSNAIKQIFHGSHASLLVNKHTFLDYICIITQYLTFICYSSTFIVYQQLSVIFDYHLLIFSPPGEHLDVKKSSYKKLSKFLGAMRTQGFIKVKELTKGCESLVEIDKDHPE